MKDQQMNYLCRSASLYLWVGLFAIGCQLDSLQGQAPLVDAAQPAREPDRIQVAVQRALPAVAERGQWWIDEKNCVSCHRVGNMVWTLGAAEDRGFSVPVDLPQVVRWAVESSLALDPQGVSAAAKNKEGIAQLLMADQVRSVLDADLAMDWRRMIAESQEEDGCWSPGGQLPAQKRPAEETRLVSTMWLALALAASNGSEQFAPTVGRAVQAVQAYSAPPQSTEWFVTALLLADAVDDSDWRETVRSRLLALQRADGGWGWLHAEASDALATGMALYALARTASTSSEAIRRAQNFLVSTQQPDGTWQVPGTKAKKKDRPQETASYWGTAWAALGLITSMADTVPPSS